MIRKFKLLLLVIAFLPLGLMAEESTAVAADETAATEAEVTAETAAEPATEVAAPTGTVGRAQFTSGIENREPTDALNSIPAGGKVYFFTELRDFSGQEVKHRWVYEGETKAEVSFNVGGNRWRVNSSKNIREDWDGTWEVQVVDGNGGQVGSYKLEVQVPVEPESEVETAAPTETEAPTDSEAVEAEATDETD